MANPAAASTSDERDRVEARLADERDRGDVGDDQRSRAVEDGPRPRRPRLDVAPVLAPEQEEEEGDREQERDPRDQVERGQRRLQAEHDDPDRDQDEDGEPAERPVGAHLPIRLATMRAGDVVRLGRRSARCHNLP